MQHTTLARATTHLQNFQNYDLSFSIFTEFVYLLTSVKVLFCAVILHQYQWQTMVFCTDAVFIRGQQGLTGKE